MRSTEAGRVLLALGFAGLGVLGLMFHDFMLWQHLAPAGLPWRLGLTSASGAVLLLAGAGLLLPPVSRPAALVLTCCVVLGVLTLQLPHVVSRPLREVYWLGLGENLTVIAGGWLAFCALTRRTGATVRAAQTVFAVGLLPIGISHFVYMKETVDMTPAFVPWRTFLAGFTGVAHIAAGLAILCGVMPRRAAVLEGVMVSLFTLIVWGTGIINTPSIPYVWVELCVSMIISGAAWVLAGSFGEARHSASDGAPTATPAAAAVAGGGPG